MIMRKQGLRGKQEITIQGFKEEDVDIQHAMGNNTKVANAAFLLLQTSTLPYTTLSCSPAFLLQSLVSGLWDPGTQVSPCNTSIT